MENILVASHGGKGFITHHDQEINGLSFQVHPLDTGQIVVEVDGSPIVIGAWKNRVMGSTITPEESLELIETTEKRSLEEDIPNQEAKLANKKTRLAELKDKEKG